MDTNTREALSSLGISDSVITSFEAFEAVDRPEGNDPFYDDRVCEPITLTAGQVWSLRGALRFQMTEVHRAFDLALMGLYDGPDEGWDTALSNVLGIDNLLAEAWAACASQDVEIPDYAPEG